MKNFRVLGFHIWVSCVFLSSPVYVWFLSLVYVSWLTLLPVFLFECMILRGSNPDLTSICLVSPVNLSSFLFLVHVFCNLVLYIFAGPSSRQGCLILVFALRLS